METKGGTFIVTGGASGLGAATARMLVAGGAKVVLADVNDAQGNALASELGAATRFVRTDVTDEASAQGRVAAAQSAFGALHARGLINCAGIAIGERVVGKEAPHALASFVRTININLIGSFNMTRLAADVMSQECAQRRRRARRDRLHRVGRGVRRSDRPGGVQRLEEPASSA